MTHHSQVDHILDNWFGEALECSEDEANRLRHLYVPLRKLEEELHRVQAEAATAYHTAYALGWQNGCAKMLNQCEDMFAMVADFRMPPVEFTELPPPINSSQTT
jgi:hypothetical protein